MAPKKKLETEDEDFDLLEISSNTGPKPKRLTDKQLETLYDETSARILQEKNDFLLPQITDLVKRRKWVNLRPEYQRRLRWDDKKKSLLVESLLMNIPIPPIFLYEVELNRYEVMDGQQRLVSIMDFYEGRLILKGLKFWPNLNGKKYSQCPPRIKRGLDRRRISAVVLLAESKSASNPSDDIRLQVFERLNTGATPLNPQELRNCVYTGSFNDLITELARLKLFNEMWRMPVYAKNVTPRGVVSPTLQNNQLFRTMGDCQIVLRFFAFRDTKHIRGSVRSMLNQCMARNRNASSEDIKSLGTDFRRRLELANKIFGRDAFQLPGDDGRLSRPLFDAIMVALDQLWSRRAELIAAKVKIRQNFPLLLDDKRVYRLIVGKPNTAQAVKSRIQRIHKFLLAQL